MTSLFSISPAKYWRDSKSWPKFLGQRGQVIASTLVQLGLPELEDHAPYSLVLVRLGHPVEGKLIYMFVGATGSVFRPDDQITLVLKRFSSQGNGLIHYGIKAEHAKI